MYEPKDKDNPKYIVFLKLDGRILPGVGLKCLAATLVALFFGISITLATSSWTEQVEIPLSAAELLFAQQSLVSERDALLYRELQAEKSELEGAAEPTQAQSDRLREVETELAKYSTQLSAVTDRTLDELVGDAGAHGISSTDTDERLEGMVAKTRSEQREVVPAWIRAVVFAVVPAVLALVMTVEQGGRSIASIAVSAVRYRRREKIYTYQRLEDR